MNHNKTAFPDESHYQWFESVRRVEEGTSERFDRIAFAMRTLRIVQPPMTVAVYPRRRGLSVDRGTDPTPERREWAIVGIGPQASREHIALAVAELAGVAGVPFAVDLLINAASYEQC